VSGISDIVASPGQFICRVVWYQYNADASLTAACPLITEYSDFHLGEFLCFT
jgi:hypothetical protein